MANNKAFKVKNGIDTGSGLNLADERASILLDFRNSKALDPRIIFSRGSSAYYWDGESSVKSRENLFTYSENFSNGAWNKTNTTITNNDTTSPSGTAAADKYTSSAAGDNSLMQRNYSTDAKTYTFSCYAKEDTTDTFDLGIIDQGTQSYRVNFDLSSGTSAVVAGTPDRHRIVFAGDGWYRCEMTVTFPAGGSDTFQIRTKSDAVSGDDFFIWGAQLEAHDYSSQYAYTSGSPVSEYQPQLKTADSGIPRFDHDPITRESLGLLMESERTNLLSASIPVQGTSPWSNNLQIDQNAAIAPDGSHDAVRFREYQNTQQLSVAATGSCSVGDTLTWSFYAKSDFSTTVYATSFGEVNVTFNLSTGTASSSYGKMTDVGGGWYRCAFTVTKTNTTRNFYIGFDSNTTPPSAKDSFFIWGVQLEEGDFETSFIKTTGSTITRARDAAYIENIHPHLDPKEGTLYGEIFIDDARSFSGFAAGIGISTSRYIGILYSNTYSGYFQNSHGSIVATSAGPSYSGTKKIRKGAMSWTGTNPGFVVTYAQDGFAGSESGVTSALNFLTQYDGSTANNLTIGRSKFDSNSAFARNCWMQKVALYRKDFGEDTLAKMTEIES